MYMKLVRWTPRVLCILAILFVSLFALDSFDPKLTIGEQILGFLIHLIPSFILAIFLAVAWKWELIGGILFAVAFIAAGIFFKSFTGNPASLIVISPFLVVGILFITYHLLYKEIH